jgi:hypothetical protein
MEDSEGELSTRIQFSLIPKPLKVRQQSFLVKPQNPFLSPLFLPYPNLNPFAKLFLSLLPVTSSNIQSAIVNICLSLTVYFSFISPPYDVDDPDRESNLEVENFYAFPQAFRNTRFLLSLKTSLNKRDARDRCKH